MSERSVLTDARAGEAPAVVRVEDLQVRFVSRDMEVEVVNGVSFALQHGEALCILGESGSGKSVTMRSLMRLLPETARYGGRVEVDGIDILGLPDRGLRRIRGGVVSMIFQEPMTALDPVYTVGQQIVETIVASDGTSARSARARALELLELVKIPSAARRLDNYPHELSGGLRQRVMIAMALACRPKVLLADEPTTALDATVQIQVLLLLRELQRELDMATIFVTHDLGVACEIADQIAVMYAGRFVEHGSAVDIIDKPSHPYTQGLMNSTVQGKARGEILKTIEGAPPDLRRLPSGCSFAPRCPDVGLVCRDGRPNLRQVSPGHVARCFRHDPAVRFD
ncbi:ABC transporter ATP-binding protein [Bosea thiooxidans]|nr:ABC transporter ATP-binding protein [Bosea sp. (in: a-proteobacteria)]